MLLGEQLQGRAIAVSVVLPGALVPSQALALGWGAGASFCQESWRT